MHVLGPDGRLHLRSRQAAPLAGQQRHRRARMEGNTAYFPQINMRSLLADYLTHGHGMGLDGNLVGHGAGGAEQAGFEAEAGSRFGLQGPHSGVFLVHVVADSGVEHGFQHGGSGARNGIGAQVDGGRIHGCKKR